GAAAWTMLTRAVALEAISTTIGGPPGRGAANPMGLVPNMALLPPQGAMEAELLAKASPTSPRSASRSTNQPTTPAEYERAMASAAMPDASAMSTNRGSASKKAGWQKPWPASTRSTADAASIKRGSASPFTLPQSRCSQ